MKNYIRLTMLSGISGILITLCCCASPWFIFLGAPLAIILGEPLFEENIGWLPWKSTLLYVLLGNLVSVLIIGLGIHFLGTAKLQGVPDPGFLGSVAYGVCSWLASDTWTRTKNPVYPIVLLGIPGLAGCYGVTTYVALTSLQCTWPISGIQVILGNIIGAVGCRVMHSWKIIIRP